jgi:putative intracellular protease/amidase
VTIDEVNADNTAVLLLPGADTWQLPAQQAVLAKTAELLEAGSTVAAICGATGALAAAGLLNDRPHTSNAVEYLKMVAPDYTGDSHYVSEQAVMDGNLITGSSVGGLLLARLVMERLELCTDETVEAWYQYFATGEGKYF